ncbi:uncharacterized protein LOC128273894 [Anopheles cruzii]|uniref:uncharacterized protein LOC128273894 n=1 Tax=Anopheles cruzii TaxID=68878 RepID=UPI0022EC4D48|nr:uncharacterized protein LOC128273894 [Anopheles cruzii]XP_052867921.1 uncharacterized protein LOC128273894 [Anopheles cruzii]
MSRFDRQPDYFIGPNGLPVLVSRIASPMHRHAGKAVDGDRNSKLIKCRDNLAIQRRGAGDASRGSPVASGRGSIDTSRRRCTTNENDITAIKWPTGRGAAPPKTTSSPSGLVPSPLLRNRNNTQQHHTSAPSSAARHHRAEELLVHPSRYLNTHKQLDNRLAYQRGYDRNIFGCNQRMDQFVLPPLPI